MDKKDKENISSILTTSLPSWSLGWSMLEQPLVCWRWNCHSLLKTVLFPAQSPCFPWQNSGQGKQPCWLTQLLLFSKSGCGARELPRSQAEVHTLSVASQEGGGARFCIRQRMIMTNKLRDYHLTRLSQSYFLGHHRHRWLVLCWQDSVQ